MKGIVAACLLVLPLALPCAAQSRSQSGFEGHWVPGHMVPGHTTPGHVVPVHTVPPRMHEDGTFTPAHDVPMHVVAPVYHPSHYVPEHFVHSSRRRLF